MQRDNVLEIICNFLKSYFRPKIKPVNVFNRVIFTLLYMTIVSLLVRVLYCDGFIR